MQPIRKTPLFLAALAVPALLLFVPALALGDGKVQGRPARAGGPADRIERVVQRLDLDQAQRERIQATLSQHRPAVREAAQTLRERTQAVRALVEDENAGDRQIERAVEGVMQARADLAHRREALTAAVRAELNPRQQAEVILMMQERRQAMRARMGPRGEGRRGEGRPAHRQRGGAED